MKKPSKKQRKLKKKQAIEKRDNSRKCPIPSPDVSGGKPLGSMIVRKKNVFTPRVIDRENISFANANQREENVSQIIFKPHAVEMLLRFINWGESTKNNEIEQQGILLGSVYKTPSGYSGVVEAVLLSEAIGNRVYVETQHSDWSKMDRQMDELNRTRKRKLVKLGWWHTHPNMPIFMSNTDRETQINYFYKDWQFAVVLNPQERKWGAFIGGEATPCVGCFINNNLFKLKEIDENAAKKSKKEENK